MKGNSTEVEQKALEINLDPTIYGTFAEIGAGQEVARYFFQAGAAAGTIAKTMSAYDKTYSDEIYGPEPSGRYVCESRLYKMLDHEYELLINRLGNIKQDTTFFAFADTISARNYTGTISGDGWLGVRFQTEPGGNYNDVVLHVKMLDKDNRQQQQAVGILGVNLIYACFHYQHDINTFLSSLKDSLTDRVMIDMIRLSGPAYAEIDNRAMSFRLVKLGLSDVAMFDASGKNIHPSEFLYRKNVLVVRGAFRPITFASYDIIKSSHDQFISDEQLANGQVIVISEMTLDILGKNNAASEADFLERAIALNAMGLIVCITKGGNQQMLIRYLEDFKVPKIGLAMTAGTLARFIDETIEKYRGGKLLEGLSGMFPGNVRLYVYPALIPGSKDIMNSLKIKIDSDMDYLYKHLLATKQIVDIERYDHKNISIRASKVLKMIANGEHNWEKYVPETIIELIKKHGLFGYQHTAHQTTV